MLSKAGINLNVNKEREKGSRIPLIDQFYTSNIDNDNKDINIVTNFKKVNKEEDPALKIDDPKKYIL